MSGLKSALRYILAVFFVGAGFNHFVHTAFYLKIMPPYLPLHLALVYLSGVFEIALGAMLMFRPFVRPAAWGLILLLVAVFPANIYVYQHQDLVPGSALLHLLRLPLQAVMIAWAYWYTRPEQGPPRGASSMGR